MKVRLILIIMGLIAVYSAFSKELFSESTKDNGYLEINDLEAKFIRVTDNEIDTINVINLLPEKGFSLICFSENWCDPSYKEFDKLYNDSIIEYLKINNTRLIVLAKDYPFLNINRLNNKFQNHIESDFEIYYYSNCSDKYAKYIPCLWLIDTHNRIIYHSIGLKENYVQLKDKLETYIKN